MKIQTVIDLPPVAKPAPDKMTDLAAASVAAFRECQDALGTGYVPRLKSAISTAERFLAEAGEQAAVIGAGLTALSVEEIGAALMEFVTAWPNASNNDLAGYGAQLAGDIITERPCRHALEHAFRKLRRTNKFVPSISDVLSEIESAQTAMRNLAFRIQSLPALTQKLRNEVERRERIEAEQLARREKLAAAKETA